MCEIKPTDKMNKLRATTETHTRTPHAQLRLERPLAQLLYVYQRRADLFSSTPLPPFNIFGELTLCLRRLLLLFYG